MEKQIKTIEVQGIKRVEAFEDQVIKQVESLKALKAVENTEDIKSIEGIFLKDMKTNEIKDEIYELKNGKRKN